MHTRAEKTVSEYVGVRLIDVQDMDLDVYLFFMREAFIYRLSQTSEGREYLDHCWRIEQTNPDRKALRDKLGGGRNV